MAAMFGAVPLAIGFGEGAELRRPLGITIVGGLKGLSASWSVTCFARSRLRPTSEMEALFS
jgi:Cu/Ag efflux pump CusA